MMVFFWCKCFRSNTMTKFAFQRQIRQSMEKRGLWLIGWYHSHPKSSPNPSLRDIDSQVEYQFKMKGPGNSFNPCLGLIVCKQFNSTLVMQHFEHSREWGCVGFKSSSCLPSPWSYVGRSASNLQTVVGFLWTGDWFSATINAGQSLVIEVFLSVA